MVIVSLRELELSSFTTHEEGPRSVRFTVGSEQIQRKGIDNRFFCINEIINMTSTFHYFITDSSSMRVPAHIDKEKGTSRTDGPSRRDQTKQSIMEKQVSLFKTYY